MDYRVRMFEKFKLSQDERDFIRNVHASGGILSMDSAQVHGILAQFFLAKQIEASSENTIESNRKLAESNNRYSKIMIGLTFVIVVLTIVNIGLAALVIFRPA